MASAVATCAVPVVRARQIPRPGARKTSRFSQIKPRPRLVPLRAIEAPANLERIRITTPWEDAQITLKEEFGMTEVEISAAGTLTDEDLSGAYETMQLCRDFENECNQAYMAGKIRGFMHLDNGQESIPALLHNAIRKTDLKHSYYRDHCHALACGVDAGAVMAELFGRDGGACRGTGGSMHIYDMDTNFQGGWALVAEQLPYAVGAARSIRLDKHLNTGEGTAGRGFPKSGGARFDVLYGVHLPVLVHVTRSAVTQVLPLE